MELISFLRIFVYHIFNLLTIALFVRVILSWFPHKPTRFSLFVSDLVDPFLNVFKRVLPNVGPLDFSPLIAYFFLRFSYGLFLVIVEFISINLS